MGIKCQVNENKNGAVTLSFEGFIDMSSSPEVRDALAAQFEMSPKAIIVNMSKVPYIDSSGIATLVEGLQWSHSSSNKFRLVGLNSTVRDIFEIARLLQVFEVFDSDEEALQGV